MIVFERAGLIMKVIIIHRFPYSAINIIYCTNSTQDVKLRTRSSVNLHKRVFSQ